MRSSTGTTYTRVAVVQLAYHPAALVDRRSPLEDPLFDPKGGPDPLVPRGGVPDALAAELAALRVRIRNAHNDQLLGKLRAVLEACRAWGVRLVVLPEYSVPWEILGGVADAAGDMVVVAGTHAVERAARKSGVYERLVAPAIPGLAQSVCPVLHKGRILSIQPKLHPAILERGSMKPGEAWAPVAMPDGLVGPLGVLVCLDFLHRESESYSKHVAGQLAQCRFLAVPSLTPHYTLPEFAGKAWEEARRYGRPVLYCDTAEGGGTAIYVDEGQPYDLRRFPDRAGYLEPGDEGVIVADVNLGYERPGRSTRYAEARPVVPVAEATFVYRAHPAGRAYAEWLAEAAPLLARDDDEAVEALDALVSKGREVLLNAGALTGAAARGRRLRRLVAEIGNVTRVEEIRQFTREVVLPEGLLPLGEVRRGMAAGAADAVFEWMKRPEVRAAGFGEVEGRLREAGKGVSWGKEAEGAIAAVVGTVRGEVKGDEETAAVEGTARVVLPKGVDPAALGMQQHGGWMLRFYAQPEHLRAHQAVETRTSAVFPDGGMSERGDMRRLSEQHLAAIENLYLLAVAEGGDRHAVVRAWPEGKPRSDSLFVISERDRVWHLYHTNDAPVPNDETRQVMQALASCGIHDPVWAWSSGVDFLSRGSSLMPLFGGAREIANTVRAQRLREVNSAFVEPDAVTAGRARKPVLTAIDTWLTSNDQTALVLGEFGVGKSTTLAEWANRRWERDYPPFPLLVNLAGVGSTASPEGLLLRAAGLGDLPRYRAALRLLVRRRLLIPCFDGFDEMATRLEPAEIAGRLSALLEVASSGGKVLISSRTNYFPSQEHLRTTADAALAQALGASAGLRRIEIQPFTDEQVRALVRKIRTEEGAADKALERIAGTYDLSDLVHRPLLLGMVLNTLDTFDTGARVGRADLYEAYLKRWLDQTHKDDPECFTDDEKMAFAEALAEELWRSGQPTCTWQELQKSVRMRLVPALREDLPVGAALLEMQGGAFFVHEGEDRYRFAHKSFLEYFLARVIVAVVADRPAEVLATKPITPEVAAFVGEILRREGDPRESRAVRAIAAWLSRRPDGEAAAQKPAAAANALRLLLGLVRWADDGKAWVPEGTDLRRVVLVKEDLRGASLVGADLSGADLSGADLSHADLSGANLERARLVGVRLDKAQFVRISGRGADFTLAEADSVDLSGADLTDAVLRQSMWTECRWDGVKLQGADVTAWAAPGRGAANQSYPAPIALLQPKTRVTLEAGHVAGVHSIAWSPNGRHLASAGNEGIILLWDVATGATLTGLDGGPLGQWMQPLAWSPDGKHLASFAHDHKARRWDVVTASELEAVEVHDGPVDAVAWSPDARRLAIGVRENAVRIWDAESNAQISHLEGHRSVITAVAWSSDGKHLASVAADRTMRLWNLADKNALGCYSLSQELPRTVAWSPDGGSLASAGNDKDVRLWHASTGREIARLGTHGALVRHVAFSPDGKQLASGGDDGAVMLWDVEGRAEVARFDARMLGVSAVAWSPDGKLLAGAGGGPTVRLWDATAASEIAGFEGYAYWDQSLAWAPRGGRLLSVSSRRALRMWDTETGAECAPLQEYGVSVFAASWSPNGKYLATAGNDGSVRCWDASTGAELALVAKRDDGFNAVAWSPDGGRLAAIGGDGIVRIWAADTRTELAHFGERKDQLRSIVWSPDGLRMATTGNDGTLRLWDPARGAELKRFGNERGTVRSVAWSPDGRRLASTAFQGMRLWDAASGTELASPKGHIGQAWAVVWSPDGRRLASAGVDLTVRLRDSTSGKEVARLEGHSTYVWSLAWSPDGKRLAGAAGGDVVHLWDVERLTLLGTLEIAGNTSIARSPGGFCFFQGSGGARAHLALHRPEPNSRTALYLPLAGLRRILHRPDKVRAALAGDLAGDDIRPELERLGWTNGVPWDGKAHRVPRTPASTFKANIASPTIGALAVGDGARAEGTVLENPFSPGPALTGELPPGRSPVVDDILALLRKKRPAPAILRGPRRSGKTSILHHLHTRLADKHRVHAITLEGRTTPLVTADDLARVLEPSLANNPTPADALRKRFQRGKKAILLIDEVANLNSADASLFAWLRAIGQEGTGVVLVGSHMDWVRIVERAASIMPGSSFGNDVTPVNLGPLRDSDALDFLVATAPPDVPLARDGTAKWILDLCGPWPFYLQVMGFSVVQAVRQGERKALVEPVGVRDLYDQRLMLDRSAGYFATRWAELPERAQRVLETIRDLPAGELPRARDLPPEDLGVLQDAGLCDELDRWLPDRPFYDWIRRIHRRKG